MKVLIVTPVPLKYYHLVDHIYLSLGKNLVLVTRVSVNVSKAFDKIWLQGLLFELKSYRVEGK